MTPKTKQEAEEILIDLGFDVSKNTNSVITFRYEGREITYFHKSQWASGKGIEDGRGWDNLIKQIAPETKTKCCPNCGFKL